LFVSDHLADIIPVQMY